LSSLTVSPVRSISRSQKLFAHDRRLGVRRIAGADEAGRGCLAGPLVVAAVCLDLDSLQGRSRRALTDLDDSKRLAPLVRERVADAILQHADGVVVLSASCRTIDREGLHRTNLSLLARALTLLGETPELCLVDGFALGAAAPPHRRVVGGDARSACIAAASVVAKVTRDRLMAGPAASAHPGFGFDRHMGYATEAHRAAVVEMGPSVLHRMSFQSSAYL
jgi:ribonuclease HII